MQCCGKKRDRRFCPECGSPVTDKPLWGLLGHCSASIGRLESQLQRMKEESENLDFHQGYMQKRCTRIQAQIRKWKSWAEALQDILKEQSNDFEEDAEEA